MRVTPDMNIRMMSEAVRRHQMTAHRLQQQISSGKKVTLASDDPGAYEMIRKLNADQNALRQYGRNADMASHYMAMANRGTTDALNILHRVSELTVQGSGGVLATTDREALAEEIDTMLQSLIAVANSSEGGRHTFAGLRTDTPPYEVVRDPMNERIIAVRYTGSEETRQIQIGDSLHVATNLAGSTTSSEGGIFQTATRDVFDSLIQLRDALVAGDDIAESGLGERLQGDVEHMLTNISLNGAREEQVRIHRAYNLEMQTEKMRSVSDLESVDIAESLMRLSQAETAYQAALHGTSRLMQQVTLLNFI